MSNATPSTSSPTTTIKPGDRVFVRALDETGATEGGYVLLIDGNECVFLSDTNDFGNVGLAVTDTSLCVRMNITPLKRGDLIQRVIPMIFPALGVLDEFAVEKLTEMVNGIEEYSRVVYEGHEACERPASPKRPPVSSGVQHFRDEMVSRSQLAAHNINAATNELELAMVRRADLGFASGTLRETFDLIEAAYVDAGGLTKTERDMLQREAMECLQTIHHQYDSKLIDMKIAAFHTKRGDAVAQQDVRKSA